MFLLRAAWGGEGCALSPGCGAGAAAAGRRGTERPQALLGIPAREQGCHWNKAAIAHTSPRAAREWGRGCAVPAGVPPEERLAAPPGMMKQADMVLEEEEVGCFEQGYDELLSDLKFVICHY